MKEHFDIHQHITNQIVAAIERGAGEFRLPWHTGGAILSPKNVESKKAYRGVNIVALWAASEQRGFSSGIWGTYRQWAQAGAQVRKGEKSCYVVFYKEIQVDDNSAEGSDEPGKRLFARATPVFAAERVDGYELPVMANPTPMEPIAAAEAFVTATGASVAHGGTRAYYRPSTLPALLQRFFTDRLMTQLEASPNTIAGYRDTFRLLLRYASARLNRPPTKLRIEDIDAAPVGDFLGDVGKVRRNSARSRNTRLAAIRSFYRYVVMEEPQHALHCQRILAMPSKRCVKQAVAFIDRTEMTALLATPDAAS